MTKSFVARFPLIALVLLPLAALTALIAASAAAEIVLDHMLLGLGSDGKPVLSNLPFAMFLINAWNLGLIYILPPVLIVLICASAKKHGVSQMWMAIGGGAIAVAGSLHHIQTVWTGVKGTSQLVVGLEGHWLAIAVRLALNAAVLFLALGPIRRR